MIKYRGGRWHHQWPELISYFFISKNYYYDIAKILGHVRRSRDQPVCVPGLQSPPVEWNSDSEIWEIFACGNPESWALESGIRLKESGIPVTESGIQVPLTKIGIRYQEPAIQSA